MIDSITVLEDGKLSAFTGAVETYLQPQIEVNTKDNLNQLLIKDKYNNSVLCDTTITSINGVAFSGSFADLETQIRELAKQATNYTADRAAPMTRRSKNLQTRPPLWFQDGKK